MTIITRRTALGGMAASALAMPGFAKAPMLGASRPMYRRVTLGGMEVTTLLDGARTVENPENMFGKNAGPEPVRALLTENRLPADKAEFTFLPVLVNTGAELVLFDTGNGPGARPALGQLTAQIEAAGYTADQVDVVVITHMHPDHIGGLMEGDAPAFPNARYVMGADEYNFWSSQDRVGTPAERIYTMVQSMVVPLAEKTTFINPGDAVVSGIEAVGAFGHTPGHMAYHIESNGQRLLLTADAANHFVLALQRPDWSFSFDADADQATATRRELFGMIAADKIPFTGYHMPYPALGYVEASGDGFTYTPASYQLNI